MRHDTYSHPSSSAAVAPLGTTTRYDEAFNGKERKRLKAEEEARKAKADAKKAEEDAARARKQRESQRDRARGSRPLRPTATMSEALAQVNVKAVMEAANKGRETVPDRKEVCHNQTSFFFFFFFSSVFPLNISL